MSALIYAFPGHEVLADTLVRELQAERGGLQLRRFPDGEAYVRLTTSPSGRDVVFACGLERPDEKSLELYFAAATARELGATRIGLVTPYLAYMRQDARFQAGEAISSVHFARWLSQVFDWLVTVDPHLHRHAALADIYSIATQVVSASPAISAWIRARAKAPLVIGPDAESAQWAEQIARAAGCPCIVLHKQRLGDRDVDVSLPDVSRWPDHVPVLIDDIISTARTMIAAVAQLRRAGMSQPPLCIGVHALFAGDAFAELRAAGVAAIATCNTIMHVSNAIDVAPQIVQAVRGMLES